MFPLPWPTLAMRSPGPNARAALTSWRWRWPASASWRRGPSTSRPARSSAASPSRSVSSGRCPSSTVPGCFSRSARTSSSTIRWPRRPPSSRSRRTRRSAATSTRGASPRSCRSRAAGTPAAGMTHGDMPSGARVVRAHAGPRLRRSAGALCRRAAGRPRAPGRRAADRDRGAGARALRRRRGHRHRQSPRARSRRARGRGSPGRRRAPARAPERLLRSGHVDPGNGPWADTIETLVGIGDLEPARDLLARYEELCVRASRSARVGWARGRGLLAAAEGDTVPALESYELALAANPAPTHALQRGRTLLALGALHRRQRHSRAAREALRRR